MQILQRVGHSEVGTKIEMKLALADWRKIHQNHVTVSFAAKQPRY